jgi:hypothetical protein
MTRSILIILFVMPFSTLSAQIKALTENGRQVVLNNDGTWKYTSDSTINKHSSDSIKLNPTKFSKSTGANFLVKSIVTDMGVYINPDEWTVAGHHENEVNPEYRFALKSQNGLAMIESEKTQIDLETMADIALINARKAAIDARVTAKEYRIVNNNRILYLEMAGTIRGIKFRYIGYYFSDKTGTLQLLSYTTDGLYSVAKGELIKFLNGFVVTD